MMRYLLLRLVVETGDTALCDDHIKTGVTHLNRVLLFIN